MDFNPEILMRQYRLIQKDKACLNHFLPALLILLFSLPFPAFAQDYFSIPFPVQINGKLSGEVEVRIDDSGSFLLSASDLTALLDSRITETLLAGLTQLPEWATADDVQKRGLSIAVDEFSLEILIDIPPDQKPLQIVSLATLPGQIYTDILEPAAFSFSANLSTDMTISLSADPSDFYQSHAVNIGITPVIHYRDWVLTSRLTVSSSSDTSAAVNAVSLIKDFPDSGIRLHAGSISPNSLRFQNNYYAAGLTVTNRNSLRSIRESPSFLSKSFFLGEPSRVEVRIDDQIKRTILLPASPYLLEDLPLKNGINTVKLTIISETGSITEEKFLVGYENSLLSPAESSYTYGLGYRTGDFSLPPTFFGLHSYGIVKQATGALGFQLSSLHQLFVADLLYAAPFGTFNASGAFSRTNTPVIGGAVYGSYTLTHFKLPRLQLSGTYYTADFTPHGATSEGTATRYSIKLSTSYSLSPSLRVSGSISTTASRTAEKNDTLVNLGLSGKVTPKLSFSLSGRSRFTSSGTSLQGTLGLTYRPDRNSMLNTTNDLTTGSTALSYSINPESLGTVSNLSVNASGVSFQSPESLIPTVVSLAAAFQEERANISLRQSIIPGSPTAGTYSQFTTTASVYTAIAYADGYFGLSRPIGDSFVIVAPGQEAEGLVLGIRQSSNRMISSDNIFNTLVIPTLSSYSSNRVSVEILELPEMLDPGSTVTTLNPGYRQGAVFKIENESSVYLTGRLLFTDHVPAGMVFGTVVDKNNPESEPEMMFTDQNGTFFIYGLKTGLFELKIQNTGWNNLLLKIEPGTSGLYDIGDLYLEIPSTQQSQTEKLVTTFTGSSFTPDFEAESSDPPPISIIDGLLLRFDQTQAAFYDGSVFKNDDPDSSAFSFTTGATGEFTIENQPPGDYTIQINKPERAEFSLTIPDTQENYTAAKVFHLDRPESRQVSTTDETAAEKAISVRYKSSAVSYAETDAQLKIRYTDGSPAANIQGSIAYTNSADAEKTLTFFKSDSMGSVYIPDMTPGLMHIRLFTQSFPKYTISAAEEQLSRGIILFLYDEEDTTVFRPKEYQQKKPVDLFSLAVPFELKQAEPDKEVLPTFSLFGRLLQHDRTQAAFYAGLLKALNNPDFSPVYFSTGREGEFRLDALPAGDYEIHFSFSTGSAVFSLEVPADVSTDMGESDYRVFQLDPPPKELFEADDAKSLPQMTLPVDYRTAEQSRTNDGSLSTIRIAYADGSPAADLQGSLLFYNYDTAAGRKTLLFFTTSDSGAIKIENLAPGSYTVRLFTPEFPKYVITITDKQTSEGVILFLKDDITID